MLLLAHRGLPAPDRPENTVAAVEAAFDAGADGVEVDLRLTADGIVAVSHDPDLRRLTGRPVAVCDQPWAGLRDLAADAGVVLACLEEVLVAAGGRHVVLEVKQPPPGPTAVARTALAVCAELRRLHHLGLPLDVTISSFSSDVAAHVRRLRPVGVPVRTALLGRPLVRPTSLLRQALAVGHDEVHPYVTALLAAPGTVETAHAVGVTVVPWTVNRRRDLRKLARLGVDAAITDVPVAAREALAPAAASSPGD